MDSLGIDIGLISVKATMLRDGDELWTDTVDHEGEIQGALLSILKQREVLEGTPTLTTGNAGRNQVATEKAIPPQAIEAALAAVDERPDAVVSLGGESIVVYTLGDGGMTQEAITGDKCAAGTGEFFRQQLGRMDLKLDVLDRIPDDTTPHALSSRCSVFMKSDCTHKLNKKEATKEEIVVSLADVMASKVVEFLTRARVDGGLAAGPGPSRHDEAPRSQGARRANSECYSTDEERSERGWIGGAGDAERTCSKAPKGRILLIGGVTRNRFLRKFLEQRLPNLQFITPPQAAHFESYGAAHLAAAGHGTPLPARDAMFEAGAVTFERYGNLAESAHLVTRLESERGEIVAGREYVLGIDGGSTTTKAVLVDAETRKIVAEHYGRTHGDPVEALRNVLSEIRGQVRAAIGRKKIHINLAATTGSSREVLGVFAETAGIYNEIIAHTVGTTHFQPDIDTIFEIGGQDAKYVYIKNGVPIDYAMNEACSAGTGSFLEESAAGDLNIRTAPEIGPIAMRSDGPLRFGEHCSAFINSDIRKAIQEGASRADIMAGIVFSVVSNYLNRVVGNRAIGGGIVLQGGVAKNPAVPIAFAAVVKQPILVPPDPELLGAFGVALLALEKHADGSLDKGDFALDGLIKRPMQHGKLFPCKTCENLCPIQTLFVGEERNRYFFGGRCNQWANARRKKEIQLGDEEDLVALREKLMFGEYAPDPATFKGRTSVKVGIPRAFSVYSLWPMYSWFFHDLGVPVHLSEESHREGVQRAESAFCLPGELAHGMTEDLVRAGVDYYFFPHLMHMESMEEGTPSTLCPLTQGLPYYLRPAFDIPDARILRPVIDFSGGYGSGSAGFIEMAEQLGFSKEEGVRAFRVGLNQQLAFWDHIRELGRQALKQAEEGDQVVIALFGRPYNTFAPEANMGIPRKFLTRGHRIIPFDFFPVSDEEMSDNMYWYYGQLNMKAARLVKDLDNVHLAYISNFGCAPDSFMLHFVRWFMGTKPYLVLELDSHTADAGVDTRIEAFLDIIEGYRKKAAGLEDKPFSQRYRMELDGVNTHILDHHTGEKLGMDHPRVRMVFPSMGLYSTQAMTAIANQHGLRCEYLPTVDQSAIHLARSVSSGKECIPTLIVLGQMLRMQAEDPPAEDEVLAFLVPKTTGPCRTGQYAPYYERTFADLGIDNVAIMNLNSDNGYQELGPLFNKLAWYALVLGDYFKDMELALRILAEDPGAAMAEFMKIWADVVQVLRDDITQLYTHLEQVAVPRLQAIPKKGDADALSKVIVVGEIYVRRDDHSVSELIDHLVENKIYPKVTGITEWINYCDYSQEKIAEKGMSDVPWYKKPAAKQFSRFVGMKVEQFFMRAIEERVAEILRPSGLTVSFPHDMREIFEDVDEFTHMDFETEATVSSLTASKAVQQGYDGIIAIAPFACLPGRLIKAMLEPYSRQRAIPMLTIEADGLRFPPNVISRLEIFMLNVLRRGDRDSDTTFQRLTAPPPDAGKGVASS